jgi:tRNA modification GTPase
VDAARTLEVWNKIDLPRVAEPPAGSIPISAHTGAGLDRLLSEIARRLAPDPPPAGAAVPFTQHQADALQAADDALRRGQVQRARAALVEV